MQMMKCIRLEEPQVVSLCHVPPGTPSKAEDSGTQWFDNIQTQAGCEVYPALRNVTCHTSQCISSTVATF